MHFTKPRCSPPSYLFVLETLPTLRLSAQSTSFVLVLTLGTTPRPLSVVNVFVSSSSSVVGIGVDGTLTDDVEEVVR